VNKPMFITVNSKNTVGLFIIGTKVLPQVKCEIA